MNLCWFILETCECLHMLNQQSIIMYYTDYILQGIAGVFKLFFNAKNL